MQKSGLIMELKNGIGARLMRLRGDRSQGDIANELGVEQRTLSHWENEERRIKDTDVIKLADFYKTTCDYILRGVESKNMEIHKVTGLTDESISLLSELTSRSEPSSRLLRTINYLLGSDIGFFIISFIDSYFNLPYNTKSSVNIYFDGQNAYTRDSCCDEEEEPNGELVPFINLMDIAEDKIFERIRLHLEMARKSDFEADSLEAERKYLEAVTKSIKLHQKKADSNEER